MKARVLIASLIATVFLAGCQTEMAVSGDLKEGLATFDFSVVMDGLVASVVADDMELVGNIRRLIEETLGVGVVVQASANRVVFQSEGPVPAASIFTSSELTGVQMVAIGNGQLSVTLTQPVKLVEALEESAGDDVSLVGAVLEATSVVVYLTGAEGVELVEGQNDEVDLSGSHLTIRRPLSSSGGARYRFMLPGVDPIVWWGLGGTAVLVVGIIIYNLRRRAYVPGPQRIP